VNVSPRWLARPGLADVVRAALADSGLSAERLTVEVTETAVFDGGTGSLIHIADGLGMTAVADGVETEAQARQLHHMGVPAGAGPLLRGGRPKNWRGRGDCHRQSGRAARGVEGKQDKQGDGLARRDREDQRRT
jgi:EAL domain-containing protein (putative c-di-GMP-specific phosphodiesterase class I)